MNLFKTSKASFILISIVLLIVSAVAYLPLVGKISYSGDEWYEMYDAHVAGPQIFHEVFNIDRPARAYVLMPLYLLFGENIFPYHIAIYFFHFLAALSLFWALDMVWPRHRMATFSMALLFLIYPGFLSQFVAIDYQPHIVSLFLQTFSIALTIKAILTQRIAWKITLTFVSALCVIGYLSLVEYAIGFEVLRLMLIGLLVFRGKQLNWGQRLISIFQQSLPFMIAPVAFLFWRLFLFQGERKATDIGAQVGQLFGSPVYKGLVWLISLFQDTIKVIFLAWAVPFYNLAFHLRLRDMLIGLVISIFIALMVAFASLSLERGSEGNHEAPYDWKKEAWIVGFICVVGGMLPVIISNRQADFSNYSRYTLAGFTGGVMILVSLLNYLKSARLRIVLIAVLVGIAILTHYANAVNAAQDTQNINNFWWQVSWRVPQIKDGTTLVASYPGNTGISEDYFVWGPANLIYAPEKQSTDPIVIRIPAAVLTQENTLQVMVGHASSSFVRRGNSSLQDFGNVLVIAQATPDGCVRIIDGSQPEVSSADAQNIMLVASKSRINNVVPDVNHQSPSSVIFGPEPDHGWCYYYEKASLAAQQGDWKKVVSLGDKALADGLYPSDRVEWMPFLRAYVMTDNLKKVKPIVSIISADAFLKKEACQILTSAAQSASADMQTFVKESFCQ